MTSNAISLSLLWCSLACPHWCQGQESPAAANWRDQPDFVRSQVDAFAAPALKDRAWSQVKIPGLREQVDNAHLRGIDRVWTNVSPGYANVIYDAKIDGGVITIILDGAGLAQSVDGGKSWSQISHSLTGSMFQSFDIAPHNSKLIIAAGNYLDRTRDGGKTWSTIYDPGLPPFTAGKNTLFDQSRFTCNGARFFVSLGSFGHGLEPRGYEDQMKTRFRTKRIYIGDADASHFTSVELGDFAGIRRIYPHPSDANLLYASFADGELYVTRNALASTPTFTRLSGLPEGFAAIDIDASPWQSGDLLMVMTPVNSKGSKYGKNKLVRAVDAGTGTLECRDLPIREATGAAIPMPGLMTARWNPRVKNQVFIGSSWNNGLVVSDDNLATFRRIPFPERLKHDEQRDPQGRAFCFETQKIYFDRSSDLALTSSAFAAWYSTDQFKTWNDGLMTFDEDKRMYGNKGAGFAECAVSIQIRPSATYLCTNDHGIFRSDGADITRWRRLKTIGLGLVNPICVSNDERYLYAFSRESSPDGSYNFAPSIRVLRSPDRGDTWHDITTRFGHGEILDFERKTPYGARVQMIIDPLDNARQWVMFTHHLFYTTNGGESFSKAQSPLFEKIDGSAFREMEYDAINKILYLGNAIRFSGGSPLARSRDFGISWELVPLSDADSGPIGSIGDTLNGIKSMGTTDAGDLVIGLNGKLVVMPYDTIMAGRIDPGMVRMTVGDTQEEWGAMQKAFGPIVCSGNDILAFVANGQPGSNLNHGMGPLLSRDGGKTFHWAAYNLPVVERPEAAAMGNGMIIFGNRGIYAWKYR